MSNPIEQLRYYRAESGNIRRGTVPIIDFEDDSNLALGIGYGLVAGIVVFLGSLFFFRYDTAAEAGWIAGITVAIGHYLWPILSFIGLTLWHRRLPDQTFLARFSLAQKTISLLVITFFLVQGFNKGYPYAVHSWYTKIESYLHSSVEPASKKLKHPHRYHSVSYYELSDYYPAPPLDTLRFLLVWFIMSIVLGIAITRWLGQRPPKELLSKKQKQLPLSPFRLWLGQSTGQMATLSHGASMAPQQQVSLNLEDAAQNILILGAIGSGKTTRAIHPLLIQLLDQDGGGLIFDIKGDFQNAVLSFARQIGRSVKIIGSNNHRMNLLAGLTPEIAASFLKSVFMLNGKHRGDPFWVDTATELCRNALGVLSFLPEHYSLQGLYGYLFDMESRLAMDEQLNQLLPTLDEKARRLLNAYWQYHDRIFDKFEEKVKASVNATVAQVLSPFNHPELIDAFCSAGEDKLPMEAVLDGAVYLVDLPLSIWGLGGKVVYTLIKLRFFNVMQQRATRPEWNQQRPVFFLCDEVQEIVSASKEGLSDLSFWDKSRSSKTIGIISAQAVSSFYAALGDRDTTHALLQNFRQKLFFKTEDTDTLNYAYHLTDKVEVAKRTESHTSSSHKAPDKLFGSSRTTSTTVSVSYTDKPVINAQLFRRLQQNQAIALLSIDGKSMDDVINMLPIYVEKEGHAPLGLPSS